MINEYKAAGGELPDDDDTIDKMVRQLNREGVSAKYDIMNAEDGFPARMDIRPDATRMEVTEEFLHFKQHERMRFESPLAHYAGKVPRGVHPSQTERWIIAKMEVEANKQMRTIAMREGWGPDELAAINDRIALETGVLQNTQQGLTELGTKIPR